jgi:hypothetical protein
MSHTIIQDEKAAQQVIERYRIMYEAVIAKVHGYYREELVLRGDQILNREYCEYFGIEQHG